MRVLHFPAWTGGNHHFFNLMKETGLKGVTPISATYIKRLFPLCVNAIKHKSRILHLHYLYPVTGVLENQSVKTALYQLLTLADLYILTKILRIKLIWTVHNLITHDALQPEADVRISRWTAYFCHTLIAHGETAVQSIIDLYKCPAEKIRVIKHGNYFRNYPDMRDSKNPRKDFKINENQKVYLFLGGISPYKGILELIDAFRSVHTENEILIIAGQCKDEVYLEKIKMSIDNDEAIILQLQFVADEDVPSYFKMADWVILPFKQNFTSGSLVLAMGFSKAIIVSDTGLNREYAGDKGALYIQQPISSESITAAIIKSRDTDKSQLEKTSFEKARSLDWANISDQIIKTYKE